MKDVSPSNNGEMMLYVSIDTKTWAKAQFPHASSARLRENAYTIVESTSHSLAVDVVLQDLGSIGTLFMSNSNGTYFVESLKDTNRNDMGFVDYENIYGVDGIGIANVVANAQEVEGRRAAKQLKSVITFDDGTHTFLSNEVQYLTPSQAAHGLRLSHLRLTTKASVSTATSPTSASAPYTSTPSRLLTTLAASSRPLRLVSSWPSVPLAST